MNWSLLRNVAALAIALSAASVARAAVAVIGGANDVNIDTDVRDATIFGNPLDVNNSNGAGPGMFAGTDGNGATLRGLIQFDIADNIPAGATIFGVQLDLSLGKVAGSGGGGGPGAGTATSTIGLHKLSTAWGEGTTGAGLTQIGGTGQGFPAGPGDATWNGPSFPNTSWTTPGGDFSQTISASVTVGTVVNTVSTWTSPTMTADVQGWLNNPSTNFGWELVNSDETDTRTFRAFWTKEAADPTTRPQLVVTYAALAGDVNGDGIVNSQDLALISSAWLNTGVGGPGDANFDGIVNSQDIALVSSNWLATSQQGAAVPEPSTIVLSVLCALAFLAAPRRFASRRWAAC